MNPADLLARIAEHGFRVEIIDTGPRLVSVLKGATMPPELLSELRRNRAAVVAHVTCSVCGRVTTCNEDRERLRPLGNAFCDEPKCPHKQRG